LTEHIFADFEYRSNGLDLVCGCFLNSDTAERVELDLRTPAGLADLAALARRWRNAVWLAYAAHAEIAAFLTAGVPIVDLQWIDLMAMSRQITATHGRFYLPIGSTNLVSTLACFGIPYETGDKAAKEAMIRLILDTPDLSPEQFASVVAYCWTDVDCLPLLWETIQAIFAAYHVDTSERVARFQGEYIKAVAELEHSSRGFPIDVPLLNRLYGNRKLVCKHIAQVANEQYGAIYLYDKPKDRYAFNFASLERMIEAMPEAERPEWQRTPTGRLRTDSEYMVELCGKYPFFDKLKHTLDLLHQFASRAVDLRDLEHDGFIKGVSLPLHTVTGRDGKLVSRGFIFGMAPFLRSLVKPPDGSVIVSADWSQQEIAVAAAMSGDKALKAALDSGDVYLSLAKQAGAIPPDGTKKTHPVQRQLYKSCQLGIGYGMGVASLGRKILLDLREQGVEITIEEATARAREVHAWHKRQFAVFWAFTDELVAAAARRGHLMTFDRWVRFCDLSTKPTALGNFPVQSNAATIMREAVKLLAIEARRSNAFSWVASLHDALYLMAPVELALETENLLRRVMQQATDTVLRHTPMPMKIRVDTHTYSHETGYSDERDTTTLPAILAMLDANGV
jgi:DNA polymerase-1